MRERERKEKERKSDIVGLINRLVLEEFTAYYYLPSTLDRVTTMPAMVIPIF